VSKKNPKKVNWAKNPPSEKSVKTNVNPESYKKSKISWHLNTIDFDFDFDSVNILNKVKLGDLNELELDLLERDCNDEKLFESINTCKNKEFDSLEMFVNTIQKNNVKINLDNLKILLVHVREDYFWKHIHPKLSTLENMTWADLEGQSYSSGGRRKSSNHWVLIKDLAKEARRRIDELNYDDHETIFSIRLSGTQRLYGFRENNYFRILWYDPNHKIFPSSKRNT
jgi:hypothetical protein